MFSLPSRETQSPRSRSCTLRVGLDVIGTSYSQAVQARMHRQTPTLSTGSISRSLRAKILVIIVGELSAGVQWNLVRHPREIDHPARHLFRALRIGRHAQINLVVSGGAI